MATAPTQLDYSTSTTHVPPGRWRGVGWKILALPTLVIPFVHFGCDESPAGVLVGAVRATQAGKAWDQEAVMICLIAACLCYGALAFIWRTVGGWGARNQAARTLGLAVGGVGVAAVVVLLGLFVANKPERGEWISLGGCLATLLVVGALVWVIRRRCPAREFVLGLLLTPFIAVGVFSLIEFYSDRKIGWYLTLFCVPVSALELVALAFSPACWWAQKETAGPGPAVAANSSSC